MAANANAVLAALGNGSRSAGLAAAGEYGTGLAALLNAGAGRIMAGADADSARYTAAQVAARDRRATRHAVGAARAATAGSGVALDEFAMPVITDIETRGAHDEAMAHLAGETQALKDLTSGRYGMLAGVQEAGASLLRGANISGWRGVQHPAAGGRSMDDADYTRDGYIRGGV